LSFNGFFLVPSFHVKPALRRGFFSVSGFVVEWELKKKEMGETTKPHPNENN